MQLSVIIVNYKAYHYLALCLFSVEQAAKGMACEIWVVDNESDPLQLMPLKQHFPNVNWLTNSENIGFAKANNQAMLLSKGAYILFLNPDTLLPENIFQQGFQYLSEHESVGAIGVQMMNVKGEFLPESKRSFPSVWASFTKLSGVWRLFPRSSFLNQYALGQINKSSIHAIEVLAGAFIMVRSALVKSLGGFDEQFFMYGEDIDLSKRIIDSGYGIHYLGNLKILHFKGASSAYSMNRDYHFYHSMELFVQKYQSEYGGNLGATILVVLIQIISSLINWKNKQNSIYKPNSTNLTPIIELALEKMPNSSWIAAIEQKKLKGWLVYKEWKIYMG